MSGYWATWSMIFGLSLMMVGGLVMWAYGGQQPSNTTKLPDFGVEAEATRRFHQRLSRWFFFYGSVIITIGLAMLLWAASHFFDA